MSIVIKIDEVWVENYFGSSGGTTNDLVYHDGKRWTTMPTAPKSTIDWVCQVCGLMFNSLSRTAIVTKDEFDLPVPCCSEACKEKVEARESGEEK